MNKKGKFLIITEGEKAEPFLMKRLFECFEFSLTHEFYFYGTNVHELYNRMFIEEKETDKLNLIEVLKEKKHTDILDYRYTDVLLIFDFEPQDILFKKTDFNKMMSFFNDSSIEGRGKLYINYPMLESYRHFKPTPDSEFIERCVNKNDIPRYKEIVNNEAPQRTNLSKYTRDDFKYVIKSCIEKAWFIEKRLNSDFTVDMNEKIDYILVLERQNEEFLKNQRIYVLNTCVTFIAEYDAKLLL
jgi:hypothetical protein